MDSMLHDTRLPKKESDGCRRFSEYFNVARDVDD